MRAIPFSIAIAVVKIPGGPFFLHYYELLCGGTLAYNAVPCLKHSVIMCELEVCCYMQLFYCSSIVIHNREVHGFVQLAH